MGLPKYEAERPFDLSTLTLFRRVQIMGRWNKERLQGFLAGDKEMIMDGHGRHRPILVSHKIMPC